MNLDIEVGGFVGESIYHYNEGTIRLIAYKGKIVSGNIRLTDHDEYIWLNFEELKNVKLAPADVPLLGILKNG